MIGLDNSNKSLGNHRRRNLRSSARLAVVVSLGLSLSFLLAKPPAPLSTTVHAQASTCENGVGGRLFSNGGNVEVEILPAVAGFTSELHFYSPGPERFIATNHDTGTVVQLGSFPAGVELIFSIYVRETQRTFYSGSGSLNPDGLAHGNVTCLGSGRSNIGFEDQLGGGDRNYADLICQIRQPLSNCAYSISPSSQSFDRSGGSGTIQVVSNSGCNWNSFANAGWISIDSGGSGSASGTIRYSVSANPGNDSRSATISIATGSFTVYQDGVGSGPLITSTSRDGKHLVLYGMNFDADSVILVNGEKVKTLHDTNSPQTTIIGKKVAKWAVAGDRLQVRTSTGALSPEYIYVP